jgi:hypothetical protein
MNLESYLQGQDRFAIETGESAYENQNDLQRPLANMQILRLYESKEYDYWKYNWRMPRYSRNGQHHPRI